MDFSNMSPEEIARDKYNKVLDGYLMAVDVYADLSLKVKDGEITAEELVRAYDDFLKPKAVLLLMLDTLRGPDCLAARHKAEAEATQADIDSQVEAFKRQLDGM